MATEQKVVSNYSELTEQANALFEKWEDSNNIGPLALARSMFGVWSNDEKAIEEKALAHHVDALKVYVDVLKKDCRGDDSTEIQERFNRLFEIMYNCKQLLLFEIRLNRAMAHTGLECDDDDDVSSTKKKVLSTRAPPGGPKLDTDDDDDDDDDSSDSPSASWLAVAAELAT
jgi:hypothetical protein